MCAAASLAVPSSESLDFDLESLDLEEVFQYLDQKTKANQIYRNERARSPTRSQTPRLLEPDHPLLQRFQIALKAHLEAQIATLRTEVFDLEAGVKSCNAERDKKGIETYEAQQIVSRQQSLLAQCDEELTKQTALTEQEALELNETEKKYKEESKKLAEASKEEFNTRNEVDVSNNLLLQFSKWEKEVENELKMNQRISEKTRKDKLKLANEKRQQDMRIHSLQSEVWRLESELETMVMQLRIKEEEREKIAQAVVTSNIEMEANESELRCLVHGWQSVINAVQIRDKEVNNRKNELTQLHEKIQSTIAEIETIKKICKKEMNKNENLTMFKMRVENDLKNCNNQLNAETNKKNNLEKSISKMQTMIEHIEEDIKQIIMESSGKARHFNTLTREFEGLTNKKVEMEQLIIQQLQDQITNDKASKYMAKMAREIKEKIAKKETNFAELENTNAQVLMEVECQKYINESAERHHKELEVDLNKIDKEVKEYMAVIKHCNSITGKHLRSIEVLQKRLDDTTKRTGDVVASPLELKIKQLELSIEDVVQNIAELQKFWMSEQGHVINLCEQRQSQLKDTNILKKQILILDQKNLKVADDIADFNKKEATINRCILALQNKLELFQKALDKKRQCKTGLDSYNFVKSREFEIQLGELELDTIKLENILSECEEEKTALANELIEKNREVLEWEKKLKMVLETKKNIKEENSKTGELGKMKLEIHRMEVRYSQLKKVSDQMITDLEHCVSRRDGMVTNALAKERRSKGGAQNTRFHYNKRFIQVKNKTKQLKNQLEALDEKVADHNVIIEELKVELDNLKQEVEKLEKDVADLREKLEEKETAKLLNFEILVFKQSKLKVYSELSKGRHPFTRFKTEKSQNEEFAKQKNVNDKLVTVVDKLLTNFPVHVHPLNRIRNSLKVPTSYNI